jgi:hypothetical protein
VKEAREFIGLKNKSNRERFEPGQSAYLINKEWLKAYKQYICHADVKRNNKPAAPENDFHPGPINNEKHLCEEDTE